MSNVEPALPVMEAIYPIVWRFICGQGKKPGISRIKDFRFHSQKRLSVLKCNVGHFYQNGTRPTWATINSSLTKNSKICDHH
jgi:hypothetical protein